MAVHCTACVPARVDFAKNWLLRTGTKAFTVSRFRKKLSPANWMQGVTRFREKYRALRHHVCKNSRNGWAKKWGLTCDRDISNSTIYTTAIYREYTVLKSCFKQSIYSLYCSQINSLWPRDTIWRHRSRSTLAQVMACCLMATSHYLNQCWLIISKVLWHSHEGISQEMLQISIIDMIYKMTDLKLQQHFPGS